MQKVLVTGGNKGIGKAICQKLLEEYTNVYVLLGSRDEARGQQAVEDLLQQLGDSNAKNRIECVALDVSNEDSVKAAAQKVADGELYGIINNAGIMRRNNVQESNQTNYFGTRRVNDAFLPKLKTPGGRIVNIASAAGPIFVSNCDDPDLVTKLSQPWTIPGGIQELDQIASDESKCGGGGDAYGFSKALVSAYTWWLAKEHPNLIINAITPGFIKTDMTSAMGASNPPFQGAIPPIWLLMSEELTKVPTGRYYGSDCKRSPLDTYRGPGDPVYEGPDGK